MDNGYRKQKTVSVVVWVPPKKGVSKYILLHKKKINIKSYDYDYYYHKENTNYEIQKVVISKIL